jgi:hypothetical protein
MEASSFIIEFHPHLGAQSWDSFMRGQPRIDALKESVYGTPTARSSSTP